MASTPMVFETLSDLEAAVGGEWVSDWRVITQVDVDDFARVTDDHQWIHVDVVGATAGPFGGPIAHGYFVLSLLSALAFRLLEVRNVAFGLNYGLERLRFITPVPVGSRVRARTRLARVEVGPTGLRCYQEITMELEGAPKPALIAEAIVLYVPRE